MWRCGYIYVDIETTEIIVLNVWNETLDGAVRVLGSVGRRVDSRIRQII